MHPQVGLDRDEGPAAAPHHLAEGLSWQESCVRGYIALRPLGGGGSPFKGER